MSLVRFRFWAFKKSLQHLKASHICGCSSMVEHQPSKLDTWVRFPSPAYRMNTSDCGYIHSLIVFQFHTFLLCASGSAVEHLLAKEGVAGSIPVSRFFYLRRKPRFYQGFHYFCIVQKSKTFEDILGAVSFLF